MQTEDQVLTMTVQQKVEDAFRNGVRYPHGWYPYMAAVDAFRRILLLMQAASVRGAPRFRCEYTGAGAITIWNPFLWDLAYTIEEADICYDWIDTQTGNLLKTGACSIRGNGPLPPELDGDRSGTEQEDGASEESWETEDT